MAIKGFVVLGLCAALLICGLAQAQFLENFCDPSCSFAGQIWDSHRFSDVATLPPGLDGYNFDYYSLDGTSSWYRNCVDPVLYAAFLDGLDLDFGTFLTYLRTNTTLCQSCKPAFVYLYITQFRVDTPSGTVSDATYLDGSYQPTQSNWNQFCSASNEYDLPDTNNITFTRVGADYVLASAPACYSLISCTYTQTAQPLQAYRSCTPNDFQGYPTNDYCAFVHGFRPYNIQFVNGCGGQQCNSLKINYLDSNGDLSRRRSSPKKRYGGVARADTDPYPDVCLSQDTDFFKR